MQTFHAFEVATESTLHVGAFEAEEDRDNELNWLTEFIEQNPDDEVQTHMTGTVEAVSVDAAITSIRAGQWSYAQLC